MAYSDCTLLFLAPLDQGSIISMETPSPASSYDPWVRRAFSAYVAVGSIVLTLMGAAAHDSSRVPLAFVYTSAVLVGSCCAGVAVYSLGAILKSSKARQRAIACLMAATVIFMLAPAVGTWAAGI